METENPDKTGISLFGQKQLRRLWYKGEWYYSIVDVVAVLTDSTNSRHYWTVLKKRLEVEGFDEALSQIEQLKLQSQDTRFRLTDTANRQTILRIIQSVPSPKAEPFKQWLAQIGEERFEEIEHPEKALERVRARYRLQGRSDEWIEERIKNDLIRNELTDEWKDRGATTDTQFAILTNELTEGTFELTVKAYKQHKFLPARANLQDHMSNIELALTSLSEATAIELHRDRDSQDFPELRRDTKDAGQAAGEARKVVEKTLGRSVVSSENFLEKKQEKSAIHSSQQAHRPNSEQPALFDLDEATSE